MKPTPAIQCPKCSAKNLPDSRFCSSCGLAFSSPSQMPTMEAPAAEAQKAAETPHVARIISSDSIPAGGFTPGTILADRYRIIGLLGRGGMGEVYRADDLKLGQPVALKFLPPKLAEDPVRRERFFAEVRITRQLSHPNICRVYDIAEIEGRHFLSMEFIDGEDLASLLKRIGHLTNEKALDIARQLAAGLAAAHERGVLHRDLKPANIMLDGHGRVRITDFGLAIAVEDESQAAEIAGTPAYMAPEQLAGKGATVRSDMYSPGLGAVRNLHRQEGLHGDNTCRAAGTNSIPSRLIIDIESFPLRPIIALLSAETSAGAVEILLLNRNFFQIPIL